MLRRANKHSLPQNRRGAVVVLVAICLTMLFGFMAFAIDLGHIAVTESELQNAADASALSGANALSSGGRQAAIDAAMRQSTRNMAAGKAVAVDPNLDVEIGIWDTTRATFTLVPSGSSTSPNAVRVTCLRDSTRKSQLPLFFAPLIGTNSANLKVSAIASSTSGSCGDIIALNRIYLNNRNRISYTDAYDSSQGPYSPSTSVASGDVCTNGHITLNGVSAINGKAARWVNSKEPNLNGPITGGVTTFPDLLSFPDVSIGNAATVNDNKLIGLSSNGNTVLIGGRFTLGSTNNPGASGKGYMSLPTGIPDSITLQPGVYYFNEMAVGSYSTIKVMGPTYIYVARQIDLSYGEIKNLNQKPMDLQIYLCNTVDSAYSIQLPTYGNLHAVIYAPHADIYSNLGVPYTLEFYGKMVGQLIRIWSTSLHVDESVKLGALKSGGEQSSPSGTSSGGISLVQ